MRANGNTSQAALIASSSLTGLYGLWRLTRPDSVIHFEPGMDRRLDLAVIKQLFKFGLPTGAQGVAMNAGGVASRIRVKNGAILVEIIRKNGLRLL